MFESKTFVQPIRPVRAILRPIVRRAVIESACLFAVIAGTLVAVQLLHTNVVALP